ncbi:unnamed protein product [Boreogadus saida]
MVMLLDNTSIVVQKYYNIVSLGCIDHDEEKTAHRRRVRKSGVPETPQENHRRTGPHIRTLHENPTQSRRGWVGRTDGRSHVSPGSDLSSERRGATSPEVLLQWIRTATRWRHHPLRSRAGLTAGWAGLTAGWAGLTAGWAVLTARGVELSVPDSSDAILPSCTFDVTSGLGAFIAFLFVFVIVA